MNQQFGGIAFNVGARYTLTKLVGSGAYGHVVVANDSQRKGQKVAVKKLNKIDDEIDAKRVLREIKIQKTMKHPNILKLFNIVYDDTVESQDFGDVYLISQYYPADLSKIIKSGQELTVEHLQYIMYQLVKAVYFLHSSSVIHRDIKPGNILATENCEVCFCDFGFARKLDEQETQNDDYTMTEYVVTRYYRAPEIMLSSQQYNKEVDIWSLGCTFAEMITGKVLFKGQNYIQMIKIIFDVLGKPDDKDLAEFINNENAQSFVDSLPAKPRRHINEVIQSKNQPTLDLLNRMLEPNPNKRISSAECLEHPFFASIRNRKDEIVFDGNFDCDFELKEEISLNEIKELILHEANYFRQENNLPLIDVKQEMIRLKKISIKLEAERVINQQKAIDKKAETLKAVQEQANLQK